MAHVRTFLTQLCVVISLSLGHLPRIVALLDWLGQPSVARVVISRRRHLSYEQFFSAADRDGRSAAPIRRQIVDTAGDRFKPEQPSQARPQHEYIPVRTA